MRRLQTRDPTLVQVLSLFLLLLAFFVVLFNASHYDKGRADAVGESLTSTFQSAGRPTQNPSRNTSQSGETPGDELVLRKLGDLIGTELRIAEVKIVRAGRLLQVRAATDDFFLPGSSEMRAERGAIVSELSRLAGDPVDGRRHKVELFVGSEWVTPDVLRETVPLPIARAAGFAEQLIARGALPGTVMAGTRPEDEGTVTLLFRIDPEVLPSEAAAAGSAGGVR
ncbi:MAG: hypothetical protein WD470_04450 [Rhodospirillaceae bacterium]